MSYWPFKLHFFVTFAYFRIQCKFNLEIINVSGMMRRTFIFIGALFICGLAGASVKYFQPPADSLMFGKADVYLYLDSIYISDNRDSLKFELQEAEIDKSLDYKGRYAVWDFVPDYIFAPQIEDKVVRIEIFVRDKSHCISQDSIPVDGKYLLKYKVDCRYRILTADGVLLREKNLGTIAGTSVSSVIQLSESLPAATIAALNSAYIYARNDVYANFGFSTFEAGFDLKEISSLPDLQVAADNIEKELEEKTSLRPSPELLRHINDYIEMLLSEIDSCSTDEKPSFLYNLAVCNAWAGNGVQAKKALSEYSKNLATFADSVSYSSVMQFVSYYPSPDNRYSKIKSFLDKDIFEFVSFYAYNDIISRVYDLPFAFPFLQYEGLSVDVASIRGKITVPGMNPVEYSLMFDTSGHPEKLSVERNEVDKGGIKNRLKINDLHIAYAKNSGVFKGITTVPSRIVRLFMPFHDISGMDSLSSVASFTTQNVLGSFMKMKCETAETISAALDPHGNIHINGNSVSSRPMGLMNSIAVCNGVEFPMAFSEFSNEFSKELSFDEDGFAYSVTGIISALYEKNRGEYNYSYLKLDSMQVDMRMLEGEDGQAVKFETKIPVSAGWNRRTEWCIPDIYSDEAGWNVDPAVSKNGKHGALYTYESVWKVEKERDERGNWVKINIGPFLFERTISYK